MEFATRPDRTLTYPQAQPAQRYTHYLFRYPAKFHPPVIRALIDEYTRPGDCVLDCFVGSGTLLVEAALSGRSAIGLDVDPVAAFVSRVKARPIAEEKLRARWNELSERLARHDRGAPAYDDLMRTDIDELTFERESEGLEIPQIPNLLHWFRRYVVIDLARIRSEITAIVQSEAERDFFMLCFASVIRAASNADPVPVSGLEVTSYMKRRDSEGRLVDPFDLLRRGVERNVKAMGAYVAALVAPRPTIAVYQADAIKTSSHVNPGRVSAVITSPPYHGAVDYYRRHQLEMFWLGFTRTQADRLALLDQYIGRVRVPNRDPLLASRGSAAPPPLAVESEMRKVNFARANGLRHYQLSMHQVFLELAKVLSPGSPAVFVVGHSRWGKSDLNTSDLFAELAEPHFMLEDVLSYEVQNRYMSYSRHNGASIDREFVLVLKRAETSV
jgi:DNA methylase